MRVPAWYVVLLAAVGVERLRELAVSREHESKLDGPRAAGATYPLMVAAHVGLLTLPLVEVASRPPRHPRWRWVAVLAGATPLRLWSTRCLGPSLNVDAAAAPELHPVASRPYRHIRHTAYVGV